MASPSPVPKLYQSVIDDVIANVRESFLDEGVDEQVLQELKQLWEAKVSQSKALDNLQAEPSKPLPPGLYAQSQQRQQHLVRQQQHLQQQQHQLQQQQQKLASNAAGIVPQQSAVAATSANLQQLQSQHQTQSSLPSVQLPMFNQSTGTFEVSGAAATAQSALGGVYANNTNTITLNTVNGPMQFLVQPPNQLPGTLPPGAVNSQGVHKQQIDGQQDSSSDDDDGDDDDNDEDDKDDDNEDQGQEEEPLNSDDDVSDEDQAELFDTDNVVVCQFDKINRAKNKWKFYLKDGIMNLNGTDYVFQKCNGDAEW